MTSDGNKYDIVVGGGLAGIVTALLLSRNGRKVQLIESEPELGGLLRTFYNDDNVPFDYGTHIPKEIGIPGLDAILWSGMDEEKWQHLDRLRVGGYQFGEMYKTSQFIDLRQMPENDRNAAIYELLSTSEIVDPTILDAEEYSLKVYGLTVTEKIIKPLMRKLYGLELKALQPSAIGLVGYSRFIGFDRFQTHELKMSKFFDQKFGHTTWDDGLSPLMNFYPCRGGVQIWLDDIILKLRENGVVIRSGTEVCSVRKGDDSVESIDLGNEDIKVDQLYWTVSPAILLKVMGQPFPLGLTPPEFRSTALVNLIFDRNFETDLWFYYCHDPKKISYRTTLYSNLRSENQHAAPFNCTVEVMSDAQTCESPDLVERLQGEMYEMGVISKKHEIKYRKVFSSPRGFPLPTVGFGENSLKLTEHCQAQAKNVTMFGRATGKTHFMHEVLSEIWSVLGDGD